MQSSIQTLTASEVAQRLGYTLSSFQHRYKKLVEKHGFPLRMPGGNFYAPAVDRWMAAWSGMQEVQPVSGLDDQRAHLKLVYGGRG